MSWLLDELRARPELRSRRRYADEVGDPRRLGGRQRQSVRLESGLREALALRAEHDHETPPSVIRKALRQYLKVA